MIAFTAICLVLKIISPQHHTENKMTCAIGNVNFYIYTSLTYDSVTFML